MRFKAILFVVLVGLGGCVKEWSVTFPEGSYKPYFYLFLGYDGGSNNQVRSQAFYGQDVTSDVVGNNVPVDLLTGALVIGMDTLYPIPYIEDQFLYVGPSFDGVQEGEVIKVTGVIDDTVVFKGHEHVPTAIKVSRFDLISTVIEDRSSALAIVNLEFNGGSKYLRLKVFKIDSNGVSTVCGIKSFSDSQLKIPTEFSLNEDFVSREAFFDFPGNGPELELRLQINSDSIIKGDVLVIEPITLSQGYYRYIETKETQLAAQNNPFIGLTALYSNMTGVNGVIGTYSIGERDSIVVLD